MDPHMSVRQLVDLTDSRFLEDQRYAMKKIANAAGSAESRVETVKRSIATAREMADRSDVHLKTHAARGLANMTERGGVNKAYLSQGTRYRSWVLAELDHLDEKAKRQLSKGGVPSLLTMARAKSDKIRHHGSRDLAWLAKDDPHVKALFHHNGGARTLLSLGKSKDTSVGQHAVEALLFLATSGRVEEDCKYLDILPALHALTSSDDVRVKRAAILAMSKIDAMMEAQNYADMDVPEEVETPDFREKQLAKLARAGVVTTLIALAQNKELRVRQHAVRGLANFAQSDSCRRYITEAGGQKVLQQCVKSADVEEKSHAGRALAFLTTLRAH
eukprot:TRINITY_DN1273_c0_g1_i2.p2 TRINITY_DN1273_c0_g1~~TRINITY_DN1273_c0_g1_i2.p2  ORF type:complete len:361 (-),score=57.44 TRINITY_DN1273_c0_g1_i2:3041-4033(-)